MPGTIADWKFEQSHTAQIMSVGWLASGRSRNPSPISSANIDMGLVAAHTTASVQKLVLSG